jgi:hydroxymethylpyrimidine/phosphomethylpyrimidine kinase
MKGRVLIIAGSDSGGGAGIQGDIKTVTALAGYGATAITALTAQNTSGVYGIHEVPAAFVAQQMHVVLDDIGADAIKTGMLLNAPIIESVAGVLGDYPEIPLVVDPVMIAKGGAALLKADAVEALKEKLIPRAQVITPNLPEAELLLGGIKINSLQEMIAAAEALLALGAEAVLLKGGHLQSDPVNVTDILATRAAIRPLIKSYVSPRIPSRHTHGTGCALASAIATGLAQGMALEEAVARAHVYVHKAILAAPGLGKGHGPLNHAHTMKTPCDH